MSCGTCDAGEDSPIHGGDIELRRPRLLDLFCKAGGAGMGYHVAGFEVVGVDIEPQPNYPFEFHRADALEFLRTFGREFDAVHGSPPCQHYSPLGALSPHKTYPDLVHPTRLALRETGLPFVIENVMSAPLDKSRSVVLCADNMGLRTVRHRRFEYGGGLALTQPAHQPHRARTATSRRRERWAQGWHVSITGDVGVYVGPEAMGIDWMTGDELSEAIPPAFTRWIGERMLAHLDEGRVPAGFPFRNGEGAL
ncbi:DNA methylase [Amycolatopsis speibonae]|uniref:DNA methylase n=1 Tax=Amycolatopsis speibonae TaxID=1450224 RepID=A0ABV7P7Z2_9PSEU